MFTSRFWARSYFNTRLGPLYLEKEQGEDFEGEWLGPPSSLEQGNGLKVHCSSV